MTDILCRWLNEELKLSKAIEPKSFTKDFSSGYLIGEVLHKYQMQNDFSMFMKKDTSISRLNNFTRLEPTLKLLGISFNLNTAQDLMQEKQGVATRLLYQLYVTLEKKKKGDISGTLMEIMQPAAKAGLHKKEHEIYSDRLHQVVKRDADQKLQKISQHYEEKYQPMDDRLEMTRPIQQQRPLRVQDEKRMNNSEKVPKPPPYTSQLNLKRRQQQHQRHEQEAQTVKTEIAQFETRKKLLTYAVPSSSSGQPVPRDVVPGGSSQGCEVPESGTKLTLQSNSKYIQNIRQRLEESAGAREQREKRRDRFLVEQLKAHEAQEDARRDEQLVKRLTRQTQQEHRLATQLLQIRMQKDVIRENRLFREQQYQQRREKDFLEALEREAALAQQAKLDRAEDILKEREFCKRNAAERAQSRYKKHFKSCKDILEQIVDLSTKVGEYRQLTENQIPEKSMREWKELLFNGLPLYEPINCQQPEIEFTPSLDPVELEKQEILNNQDYDEYTNMVDEWAWPEEAGETKLPLTNNNILGHVVQRLRNMVHQPIIKPSSPSFPQFTFKACVLGKLCSGKTTCLAKLAEAHGINILSADTLIEEALDANRNQVRVTEEQEEKGNEQLLTSCTSLEPDLETEETSRKSTLRLSTRAMQGAAADKELRQGNPIPYDLVVDIIVEAIRQVPAQSGWILDGFPLDITQAFLLERALGGCVDEGNCVVNSRTDLAADPNPPEPPTPPPPVLDLALLLDIPEECVIRRAFSHTDQDSACPKDKTLYLAQIPHRIAGFEDTWPKLEDWFGEKQSILVRIDADVNEDELYERMESVLQQVWMQTQEALATSPVEDVMLDSGKAPDSPSSAELPPAGQPQDVSHEAPDPTESETNLSEEKAQSLKSLSKTSFTSPGWHSRKASMSSVINEDSKGVPVNPPESPCPGPSSWEYVDEPLPPEVPGFMCPHWDTVCDSYVKNVKTVMQQIRSQSSVINHHLFNIREDYKHYLGRPDLRQELVSHWQKDFNSIPDDMRKDEDTKAELHLRLDELRERLWDISDKCKEEDEQEKAALMGDGWLEEHTVILINCHSKLMQVESDRLQDTLCILRVYYLSMCREVLPKLPSRLACIPLLDFPEVKDQDERSPDSKEKIQDQTEPVKLPQDKLISDYTEVLRGISKLVSAEAHQEMKEKKGKPQEKEKAQQAPADANKNAKGKKSSEDKKGPPSPPCEPSPAPPDTHHEDVKLKIHKEYAATLAQEENAAKMRIALVKGHGLRIVNSLQSRAEETLSNMEKWLEAHYLPAMKSIDQLSEVIRHHIEAGDKLTFELVLECTDFYQNGDCLMVASPAPPPRPAPLEKPTGSTPTITQLQSLHQQLCNVAPSGLISSFEFDSLLRDLIVVTLGKNTLPEPWIKQNETQMMEIVSLLTDEYELIDWRKFLLSAALPWPFPSLSQLLTVLQRFKAADHGNTGYINEEKYLQTELWFSSESVLPVPEDPSEPLPYDRLANLRKFFFQLFADHSFSPSRLDYLTMLQYFAADPNPRQGFIRALSVVLGQHLKHSSQGHLVKSMPNIEEATELDEDYKEAECALASSSLLGEQEVSIPALLAVIFHKVTKIKDVIHLPPDCLSQEEHTEQLAHIFRALGYMPEDCIPFSVLSLHPFIQDLMETSTHFQLVNIHRVLLAHRDEGEANSSTVS
ncbi:sperm flagellar protein 2 [Trematomus bernacchii]|uniref:sperm flagellar protein 2 n=1 Tax=Trematomus bernacchii TaxID=40690 RepID=UPI00146DA7F4|nr:sperm flagellar protein 2 [Trematomus bernacchii]